MAIWGRVLRFWAPGRSFGLGPVGVYGFTVIIRPGCRLWFRVFRQGIYYCTFGYIWLAFGIFEFGSQCNRLDNLTRWSYSVIWGKVEVCLSVSLGLGLRLC